MNYNHRTTVSKVNTIREFIFYIYKNKLSFGVRMNRFSACVFLDTRPRFSHFDCEKYPHHKKNPLSYTLRFNGKKKFRIS